MSSGKGAPRPRGETEAEKTLRKRREAEQKSAQMVDSRSESARHQSRSSPATNDGLGDAAASGKRKADASSTPPDSQDKLPRSRSRKGKRSDASLQSSSEDDEASLAGAVIAGKGKLARHTGLQSVQVK